MPALSGWPAGRLLGIGAFESAGVLPLPAVCTLAFQALDVACVRDEAGDGAGAHAPDIAALYIRADDIRAIADLGGTGTRIGALVEAVVPGLGSTDINGAATGVAVVAAQTLALLCPLAPELAVLRGAGPTALVPNRSTSRLTLRDVHAVEIAVGAIPAFAALCVTGDRSLTIAAPHRNNLSRQNKQATNYPHHQAHRF